MNCLAEQKLVGSLRNYIQDVDECTSEVDLFAACKEFTNECGYQYFALLKYPEDYHYSLYELMLSGNWPAAMVKAYDHAFLLKESPFAEQTRDTDRPFLWTAKEMYNSGCDQKEPVGRTLFSQSSMSHGVGIRTNIKGGQKGFLILTGNKSLKNEEEFDELQDLANQVFAKAMEIIGEKSRTDSKLSKREYECLLWTSEGKTSYEIGMILGLSENTINNYLVTVGRKLGAVNRPHMVGIALRRGYI